MILYIDCMILRLIKNVYFPARLQGFHNRAQQWQRYSSPSFYSRVQYYISGVAASLNQ